MIALIEDACVEKKKWITHDDMMNVTVIAESTPGPIAINCATFVGYRQGGLKGAVAATIGMVLPSFLIIFLISCFYGPALSDLCIYAALQDEIRHEIKVGALGVDLVFIQQVVDVDRTAPGTYPDCPHFGELGSAGALRSREQSGADRCRSFG